MPDPIYRKGEWITRASTGERVFRVARDIYGDDEARPDQFDEWQIAKPSDGDYFDEAGRGDWWAGGPAVVILHTETGWRDIQRPWQCAAAA